MRHYVADMHETWKEQSPCSTGLRVGLPGAGITQVNQVVRPIVMKSTKEEIM
jgi:hypothetical protein